MENIQCGQPPNDCGHNDREQNRERVHITLVKNSQDHIHDKDCSNQQERQGSKQLSEHERFALEGSLHGWVMRLDLGDGVLDVLRSIANCAVWQQVEVERDTSELVQMVHGLRPKNFLG